MEPEVKPGIPLPKAGKRPYSSMFDLEHLKLSGPFALSLSKGERYGQRCSVFDRLRPNVIFYQYSGFSLPSRQRLAYNSRSAGLPF
jgi:hypothetical protein